MTLTPLNAWRLADELSVLNAAILIAGGDPGELLTRPVWTLIDAKRVVRVLRAKSVNIPSPGDEDPRETRARSKAFMEAMEQRNATKARIEAKVRPVLESLKTALLNDRLAAAFVFLSQSEEIGARHRRAVYSAIINIDGADLAKVSAEPSWEHTTVEVNDLKAWLERKNVYPDFFFPSPSADGFENPNHERYSAELACAAAAWRNVTTRSATKSVKATIKAWVAANAIRFGVDQGDGTPSSTAVERISMLVNWDRSGGSPPTPAATTDPSL